MSRFFPVVYDLVMFPLERIWLGRIREALISKGSGLILEIGAGTGANFPYYPMKIEKLIVIEPDPGMILRSGLLKASDHPVPVIVQSDAQSLPFAENTFDTIVATLVFCTIPDPLLALREARRVLKPGGHLLLLEHVRLKGGLFSKIQDGLTPAWKHLAGGCHLNRDTLSLLKQAGFQIKNLSTLLGGLFVVVNATS